MTILHLLLALCVSAHAAGRSSMMASTNLQPGQVDTAALASDAVTTPKLLTSAVTGVKIAPLTIDSTKLTPLSVDSEKIVKGAVNTEKTNFPQLKLESAANGGVGVNGAFTVNSGSATLSGDTSALIVRGAANTIKLSLTAAGSLIQGNGAGCQGHYCASDVHAAIAVGPVTAAQEGLHVGSADYTFGREKCIGFGFVNGETYSPAQVCHYPEAGSGRTYGGLLFKTRGTDTNTEAVDRFWIDGNGAVTVGSTATFQAGIGGQAASGGLGVIGSQTNLSTVTIKGSSGLATLTLSGSSGSDFGFGGTKYNFDDSSNYAVIGPDRVGDSLWLRGVGAGIGLYSGTESLWFKGGKLGLGTQLYSNGAFYGGPATLLHMSSGTLTIDGTSAKSIQITGVNQTSSFSYTSDGALTLGAPGLGTLTSVPGVTYAIRDNSTREIPHFRFSGADGYTFGMRMDGNAFRQLDLYAGGTALTEDGDGGRIAFYTGKGLTSAKAAQIGGYKELGVYGALTVTGSSSTFINGIGGQAASGGLGVVGALTVLGSSITAPTFRGAGLASTPLFGDHSGTRGLWLTDSIGAVVQSGHATAGSAPFLEALPTVVLMSGGSNNNRVMCGSDVHGCGINAVTTAGVSFAITSRVTETAALRVLDNVTGYTRFNVARSGNVSIATGDLDTNKIVMNVPATFGGADSAKIGIGTVNPIGHLHVMSGSADTAKISVGDATHGGCIMMGSTGGCFECGITGAGAWACQADADCVCDGTIE